MTTRDYLRWFWRSLLRQRAAAHPLNRAAREQGIQPISGLDDPAAPWNAPCGLTPEEGAAFDAALRNTADLLSDENLDAHRISASIQAAIRQLREQLAEAHARLAEIGEVATEWSIGDTTGSWTIARYTEAGARANAPGFGDGATAIRRLVGEWRTDTEPADATAAAHSATHTDAESARAHGDGSNSSATAAGPPEPEPDRDTSAWCWAPNPHGRLHCGLLKNHPPPHLRGERTWTDDETGAER